MAHFFKILFLAISIATFTNCKRTLTFKNSCKETMWLQAFPEIINPYTYPLNEVPKSLDTLTIKSGETKKHEISEKGWAGAFLPSFGCNAKGENCTIGGTHTATFDKKPFTYPKNGNTLIRFYYPAPPNSVSMVKYSVYNIDISNGFYAAVKIVPTVTGTGNCKPAEFSRFPCPTTEKLEDVGVSSQTLDNISLVVPNKLQCLSPCAYIYGPGGPIFKYDATSNEFVTYFKKKNGTPYNLGSDNYCCAVGEAHCTMADTEYYKGLQGASGNAASVGPYYTESGDFCYETLNASYDVTISCPENSAPAPAPGC